MLFGMTKNSPIRGVLEWYKDVQFTSVYRKCRALTKEINLRREALNGVDMSPLTENFIGFLRRRIDILEKRRDKMNCKLTRFMGRS